MTEIRKTLIEDHLASKTKATALASLKLGSECSLALWSNSDDEVIYEQTEGHAFSFYLAGGKGSTRLDQDNGHGWPGAICVMPQGHNSRWLVTERIEFLHLYLSDSEIRRLYAQTFDKDSRLLDVREHTFVSAQKLTQFFLNLQDAVYSENTMLAQQSIVSFFYESMTCRLLGELNAPSLSGGLSPKKLKMVKDYCAANLSHNISLKELADLVGLSEYHFQRNFTAQCGVSPHIWLTRLRLEQAKDLIRQNQKMVEIADACGFSSQSHFARTFKRYTGITPGTYSKKL